ncbi:hypothetical protein vBCbaSRXM_52 [Citromicrobium phage vB_CbaS-RXM]|nr:hypothetical protein vBCbaSRXM_52 [Citromicrobium phage vB_CbaS-RXM]
MTEETEGVFQVTYWVDGDSHRLTGDRQHMAAKFIMAENDEAIERATMSAYDEALEMPTGPVLQRFDRR